MPIRLLGRTVDWAVITIGAVMATLVFVNVCPHLFHKDLAWVTETGEVADGLGDFPWAAPAPPSVART